MKSYKIFLSIFIGLVLILSIKAYLYYQKPKPTKPNSLEIKYEVASQSRQDEEKFWKGNF